MPFKFPCVYCHTTFTDNRDEVFNGMRLKCPKCGKLMQAFSARQNEASEQIVLKGETY
jgi:hypothetical protein